MLNKIKQLREKYQAHRARLQQFEDLADYGLLDRASSK